MVQERERARGGVHAPPDTRRTLVVTGTLELVLLLLRRRVDVTQIANGRLFGFVVFVFSRGSLIPLQTRLLPPPHFAHGHRARRALVVLVRGRDHAEAARVLHASAHHSFVPLLEHVQRDLLAGDHRVQHEQRQLHRVARDAVAVVQRFYDTRFPSSRVGGASALSIPRLPRRKRRVARSAASAVLAVEGREVQFRLAVPRFPQRVVQEALAQVRERGIHRPLVRALVVQRRAARRARALAPGLAHPLGEHAARKRVPAHRGDGIDEELTADGARQRVQERLFGDVEREAAARRVRSELGGVHGLHPGGRPSGRPRDASHRSVIRRRR